MPTDGLHMGVNPVGHCMHYQMADTSAVFRTDTREIIVLGVDDSVVLVHLRQKTSDAFTQCTLGVLTYKDSNGSQ